MEVFSYFKCGFCFLYITHLSSNNLKSQLLFTILGFTSTYGNWISIFSAIAMCCFAFSTILGWGLYGARCIEFLFSPKVIKPFMVVYALVAIVGATMDLGLIWGIADTFNGLMSIPNLIALFLLSGTVIKLVKEYKKFD